MRARLVAGLCGVLMLANGPAALAQSTAPETRETAPRLKLDPDNPLFRVPDDLDQWQGEKPARDRRPEGGVEADIGRIPRPDAGASSRAPGGAAREGGGRRRPTPDVRGYGFDSSAPHNAQTRRRPAPERQAPRIRDSRPPGDRSVETGDLSPVLTDDTGLPHDLWAGLDMETLERLMSHAAFSTTSPVLQQLWRRLLATEARPPAGGRARQHFLALRLHALNELGRAREVVKIAEAAERPGPLVGAAAARARLALGDEQTACRDVRGLMTETGELPKRWRADLFALSAYCSLRDDNARAAMLAVDLAREQGLDAPFAFAVVDSVALGRGIPSRIPTEISVLQHRLMELAGARANIALVRNAGPGLAASIARDGSQPAQLRAAAGERAVRFGAIEPDELGKIYRASVNGGPRRGASRDGAGSPALTRAQLYQAVLGARDAREKTDRMAELMDLAARDGLALATGRLLAEEVRPLRHRPEFARFGETAIEILAAAGDNGRALGWAVFADEEGGGRSGLLHWLALLDIAEAGDHIARGSGFSYASRLAAAGRMGPDLLHRLVTVLEALSYNVPIPLWERASQAPQPDKGHLPETGLLSALKISAERKDYGRTILLAITALGPDGAKGAHIIALGDAIRALDAIGLQGEARRLGFEALFGAWPRNREAGRRSRR